MASDQKEKHPRTYSKCPVTFALDLFGDKWSLLIIRDILFKQKVYYSDFLLSSEKISTNILANRLAKLEAEGILLKRRDPQKSSKYIYSLTQKGKDLLPLLLEMIAWSASYDTNLQGITNIVDGAPPDLVSRYKNDKQALIEEILAGLLQ